MVMRSYASSRQDAAESQDEYYIVNMSTEQSNSRIQPTDFRLTLGMFLTPRNPKYFFISGSRMITNDCPCK